MINKHVIGRLGNQMFQYATVRAFQIKNRPNDKILLDFSEVYQKDSCGYREELSSFNISDVIYGKAKLTLRQKLWNNYLNFIKFIILVKNKFQYNVKYNQDLYKIEKRLESKMNKAGLYSFRLGYYDFKDFKKDNIIISKAPTEKEDYKELKRILKKYEEISFIDAYSYYMGDK